MSPLFLDAVSLVVLCVILSLGLWPFHAPANAVAWMPHRNGLQFGRYATVFSSLPFPMTADSSPSSAIEIWLRPRTPWDSATILSFPQFSLRQSQLDLEISSPVAQALLPAASRISSPVAQALLPAASRLISMRSFTRIFPRSSTPVFLTLVSSPVAQALLPAASRLISTRSSTPVFLTLVSSPVAQALLPAASRLISTRSFTRIFPRSSTPVFLTLVPSPVAQALLPAASRLISTRSFTRIFPRSSTPVFLTLVPSPVAQALLPAASRLISTRSFTRIFPRSSTPVFLTLVSTPRGTSIYRDGVLSRFLPALHLPAFTGRLVLGDSPGQPDNWSGQILGLALYRSELTPGQVLRHYQSWTQSAPPLRDDATPLALYRFDEHSGNIVHDRAASGLGRYGMDLYIPPRYMVLDKLFLEPFWQEFRMSRGNWRDILKNIVGFIPLGACFWASLSAHRVSRAALVTVFLGFLVSLTIEVLQAWLPTRDSGTTDLITNTLGTWIGVVAGRAIPFPLFGLSLGQYPRQTPGSC